MEIGNLRKIIREILEEVFDNPTFPKDTEILTSSDYIVYKFKTSKRNYAVSFTKKEKILEIVMPKDEKAKEVIRNSKSIYLLS